MEKNYKDKFTKYEIARILGARSLQLAMDAPILLKLSEEDLEKLDYDSLKIAEKELEAGVLPITVKRPFPKKSSRTIKKILEQESEEKKEKASKKEKDIKKIEKKELKSIKESGEIMEIATPEDEEFEEEIEEEIEE